MKPIDPFLNNPFLNKYVHFWCLGRDKTSVALHSITSIIQSIWDAASAMHTHWLLVFLLISFSIVWCGGMQQRMSRNNERPKFLSNDHVHYPSLSIDSSYTRMYIFLDRLSICLSVCRSVRGAMNTENSDHFIRFRLYQEIKQNTHGIYYSLPSLKQCSRPC